MRFNPNLANKLPNGATILMRKKIRDHVWVWLADYGGYQPYVTWVSTSDGDTIWGNYHSKFSDAVLNFHKRVSAYKELYGY